MTLAITDIYYIKELYFKKGLNVAQIMRKTYATQGTGC